MFARSQHGGSLTMATARQGLAVGTFVIAIAMGVIVPRWGIAQSLAEAAAPLPPAPPELQWDSRTIGPSSPERPGWLDSSGLPEHAGQARDQKQSSEPNTADQWRRAGPKSTDCRRRTTRKPRPKPLCQFRPKRKLPPLAKRSHRQGRRKNPWGAWQHHGSGPRLGSSLNRLCSRAGAYSGGAGCSKALLSTPIAQPIVLTAP